MSEAKKLAEYLGFEVVYLDGFGYIQEDGEQGPEIKREANLEERTMWTDLVRLSAELAALKAAMGEPVAWMMQWPNHSPSFTTDKSDYASWFAGKVSYPDGLVSLYAIPKDKP